MKRERIRAHYERRVAPERESHDILDWSSRQAQMVRFGVLVDALCGREPLRHQGGQPTAAPPRRLPLLDHLSHASLLDVGCGLTDLATFLFELGWRGRYVGIDITPAILREARRRHPDRAVLLGDVFAAPPFPDESFDVVYCSGVFNLRLGNNWAFVQRALPALYRLANQCVVTNFLHVRTARKYPHCCYFDPAHVRAAVPAAVPVVQLFEDYLDNDFTLVLRRGPVDEPAIGPLSGEERS